MQANGSRQFAPERNRDYLHLLARLNLPRRLRGPLSASDVAHDTILKAHKKREQFRGQSEAEYRGWLRRILANTIADAAEVREPDLLRMIEQSSASLEDRVALDDLSLRGRGAHGAAAPARGDAAPVPGSRARSLAGARRQVLSMWMYSQIARHSLEADLGLPSH
jgi:RNA polymerase sigma-70 factor (ECF subfamily)